MSKELIVSATRHETRVAILEEDQLVEIYHQREKEYSLAGSIHKGRVTRVLPGMQSAFVDIGLERDAFLYVSDFFEDNEEYDKIVSGVEEKVLKMEKGGQPIQLSTPIEPELAAVLGAVPGAMISATPPPAPAAQPSTDRPPREGRDNNRENRGGEPRSGENRDGRGDNRGDGRGGRGRRSRSRRRGGSTGGGGLPESKFFSPREERPPVVASTEMSAEPDGGLIILPGESISKYVGQTIVEQEFAEEDLTPLELAKEVVREEHQEALAEHPDFRSNLEAQEDDFAGALSVETSDAPGDLLEAVQADDTEPADSTEERDLPVIAVSEVSPVEPIASEEISSVRAVPLPVSSQPETSTEFAEDTPPEPEFADPADIETLDELESEEFSAEEATAEAQGDELAANDATDESEEGEKEEGAAGQEGPEPARTPTSLTAALREQGGRLPHRVSRRMRRRMRGGERDGGERTGGETRRGEQNGSQAPTPIAEVSAPAPAPAPVEEPKPDRRGGRSTRDKEEIRPVAPSIADLLRSGQEIIVQIAKEPLGQKGARITSHIALPGRFLVYMPTVDHIGVSRKIPSDEERQRLKRILQGNRSGIPGGFIVRTAGENRSEEELRADMMFLYNLWLDMRGRAEKRPAPMLLHHDLDLVERILRDQLTGVFKTVWVDSEVVYESVLGFVQRFQPSMVSRIKLYTRPTPIFDEFGITQELEKALRPKVWLKSGGYIVINQTEALVAIDINTGKYVGKSNRLEDTIVKINTDAIREIVRQIRLRDLGGIIVVDFIDMDERKNRQKVMQVLEEAMRVDRAPYKILQFNDFGLVAITRKRVKQSLERTLCAPCPYCEGAGYVKSVSTVIGEILQEAAKLAKMVEGDNVMLRVNPEVAKVLKSNSNDHLEEVESIIGKTVIVKSDPQLHQTKFDLA